MQRVADISSSDALRGDEQAEFAAELRPLIDPAFRLAMAMLHDRQAAEDAVQDACITAWAKSARVRDRSRIRPWFLGVVANKCRNARRSGWRSKVDLGVPEDVVVAATDERSLRGADLRRAIARLDHDDRLVVVLYFFLDLPLVEVASAVHSSVGATRSRLYRSIKRLRPDLEPEEATR